VVPKWMEQDSRSREHGGFTESRQKCRGVDQRLSRGLAQFGNLGQRSPRGARGCLQPMFERLSVRWRETG